MKKSKGSLFAAPLRLVFSCLLLQRGVSIAPAYTEDCMLEFSEARVTPINPYFLEICLPEKGLPRFRGSKFHRRLANREEPVKFDRALHSVLGCILQQSNTKGKFGWLYYSSVRFFNHDADILPMPGETCEVVRQDAYKPVAWFSSLKKICRKKHFLETKLCKTLPQKPSKEKARRSMVVVDNKIRKAALSFINGELKPRRSKFGFDYTILDAEETLENACNEIAALNIPPSRFESTAFPQDICALIAIEVEKASAQFMYNMVGAYVSFFCNVLMEMPYTVLYILLRLVSRYCTSRESSSAGRELSSAEQAAGAKVQKAYQNWKTSLDSRLSVVMQNGHSSINLSWKQKDGEIREEVAFKCPISQQATLKRTAKVGACNNSNHLFSTGLLEKWYKNLGKEECPLCSQGPS